MTQAIYDPQSDYSRLRASLSRPAKLRGLFHLLRKRNGATPDPHGCFYCWAVEGSGVRLLTGDVASTEEGCTILVEGQHGKSRLYLLDESHVVRLFERVGNDWVSVFTAEALDFETSRVLAGVADVDGHAGLYRLGAVGPLPLRLDTLVGVIVKEV